MKIPYGIPSTKHDELELMGPWFAADPPPVLTAALPQQTASVIAWFCQNNSISISSLSVLAPAAPVAPHTLPPPHGVGVHCRRCYCLFKFTQEPLKEPQGPLVRLPTLKTSKSLKIHYWRPALALPHRAGRRSGLCSPAEYMIVWLYEKLTWLPCGARGGTSYSTGSSAMGSL